MSTNRVKIAIRRKLRQYGLLRVKKSRSPLRWGIVGLGHMSEFFAQVIDDSYDNVVTAVASRSIEKAKSFASRHGAPRSYGRYIEMLTDDSIKLDVVYVATPVKYHYEHVKMCLEAGQNVLCEKPITSNAAQLEELIVLAQERGCFLMEGMWMKCLPTYGKAHQWLNEGRIGALQMVKVDFYKREHIRPELTIYNLKEGGGVLRDFGVYSISMVVDFLCGQPTSMTTQTLWSKYGIDADWQIAAEKSGVKACVSMSSRFGSLSKAALIGSEGTIEWESQFNRTNRVTLYNAEGVQIETFTARYTHEGFEYELTEVCNCIRSGERESAIVPLGASLDTMRTIDKLMTDSGDD